MELRSIVAWVTRHFHLGDVRRSRALAEMTWGLMRAGVVSYAAIGRAMTGAATAASQITRVFRFCHNEAIAPSAVQGALVNLLVGHAVRPVGRFLQQAVVSIDWHSYDNGDISGLRINLVTGSRALPLLWYEVRTKDLKGQQVEMQRRALLDLIALRPPGVTWVVLLDIGFSSVEMVDLLQQVGHFVMRQRVTTLVHSHKGWRCWAPIGKLPVRLGQVVEFGWVYWAERRPRKVRLVAARLYLGKRPGRGRRSSHRHYKYTDPGLCLLTTDMSVELFDAVGVVRLYARRFEIEHNFRDLKNATLGMDMEHVHLAAAGTYSRLMCIVAVTEALLWLTGAEAEAKALHLNLSTSRPRSGRRVLSLRNVAQLCLDQQAAAISRLIKTHLRTAIIEAPYAVGHTWKDPRERLSFVGLAGRPEDLRPLGKQCRNKRFKAGYQGPCSTNKWTTRRDALTAPKPHSTRKAA